MTARPRIAALALAMLALALVPAAASGATLQLTDPSLNGLIQYTYTAGAGNNNVTAFPQALEFEMTDTAENITVDPGTTGIVCTGSGTTSVDCPAPPTFVTFTLAAGNDTINFNAASFPVDTNIDGGSSTTTNTLNGGNGNDTFEQSSVTDDDTITGGGGTDLVNYAGRAVSITATINAGSNDDGAAAESDTIGAGVENVNGSNSLPNNLTGDSGNNVLQGGSGNDTFNGEGGNDTIGSGGGTDTGNGGDGDDFFNSFARGTANGDDNDDHIVGGGTMNGGEGDDVLETQAGGIIFMNGGGGHDVMKPAGTGSREIISGGSGTDFVDYSTSPGPVFVTLDTIGNDGISGEKDNADADGLVENITGTDAQADTLTGDSGANLIRGLGNNDTLNGEGGDDQLDGGLGSDVLNGGSGTADKAYYVARSTPIEVTLDNLKNDGSAGEGDSVGPLGDIEGIQGGDANDVLTGNGSTNQLDGFNGEDFIRGEGGADTINGGNGADDIEGGSNLDTIFGNGGSDTIDGGSENDTLNAGSGADFIDGGTGVDGIDAGTGPDQVRTKDSTTDGNTACGEGYDVLVRDAADPNTNCEDVLATGGTRVAEEDSPRAADAAPATESPTAPVPGGNDVTISVAGADTITCTSRKAARGVTITCRVAKGGTGAVRLVRDGKVRARGRIVRGRVRLRAKRRLRPGRYTLVVGNSRKATRLRAVVG